MSNSESIWSQFDVTPAINASGTKTTFGGPIIRQDVVKAMQNASYSSVDMTDLFSKANSIICDVTGAEAGHVTCGASSGLTLAAAACIAENNLDIMEQLPNTNNINHEIIMLRSQRNVYDHALRVAGASITDVGDCSRSLGMTSTNVEPWQLDNSITEETVAVAFLPRPNTQISLQDIVDISHSNDVPVILDAAGCLPPHENLSKFIDIGVDIVSFSGGKGLRGPQCSGFIAGKKELIQSAVLQHLDMGEIYNLWNPPNNVHDISNINGVPRHGIGRGYKLSPQNIIGLLKALELFANEDASKVRKDWLNLSRLLADNLNSIDELDVVINTNSTLVAEGIQTRANVLPKVSIKIKECSNIAADDIYQYLLEQNPKILVKPHTIKDNVINMTPFSLNENDVDYISTSIISYFN